MYTKDIKKQPNADDEYWKESEFESNYQKNNYEGFVLFHEIILD